MSGVISLISVLLGLTTIVLSQDIREPPTIVEPLTKESHFYRANDRVTITCRATGTPQPTYEWRYNDNTISSQFMSFDAITGVLIIPSLSEREEGLFTCRATNRFPNGQSATAVSATVEIRVARVGDFVTSPPKTISAIEGTYLKLACDYRIPIHYGPTTFRWYITTLDNKLTEIIQGDRIFIDQVGSLHFAYVLKSDESVLGTRYQCALSNSGQGIIKLGSDNIVTVTAQGLQDQNPVLRYRSMGKSMVVLRNGDALLECLFSGYTSSAANKVPSVTWFDDAGVQISGSGRYVIGPFGRTLIIKSVQESDEKTYTCHASNAMGQEIRQVSLNVTSTPIWVKPLEKVTIPESESAKFTCIARSAAGENPPDPPEWYLNGIRMASNYDPTKYIFSEGKRELTVLHTNKNTDIACFQCYVGNSNGQEFDDGCLNVILQINIIIQPPKLYQEIERGDIVNLTVVATGDPSTPLTYRWLFQNKTYDDLSPPPHVQVNPVTKVAFINTTGLSEPEIENLTGIYRREVFHQYQAKHIDIEVGLKRVPTVETTASTTQVTTSHGHHDITCTESRMEFSIPLSSPHTSETATLSDPNCQINLTRTHVRGGVDLNSCGTTVQFQNDSVIFRNAIIFSAPASSSLGSNGSDDSVSQYQDIIPIECVYNRIATVHLSYMPVVRRVLFTESGVGQFSFNIQQFWDASFTSVVSDRAYPLRLEQDADIFIQLSVGSEGQPVAGHKEIGMEVQQCLVSPSSSVIEAQLHYYPLIQDGCPASSDVHIIPNTNASDSTVMRFRFRAVNFFDPSSSSSSSLVFVHCRMGLCLTGSCKPSAWTCLTPPARRVRRDVDQSRRAAHQLSTGPFLIMADEASASSSSTTATVMAVVSTSVATVAIVVAAIALIALRRRRTTARN